MMSGHGASPIFFNNEKIKTGPNKLINFVLCNDLSLTFCRVYHTFLVCFLRVDKN